VNTEVTLLSATLDHGRSETCPTNTPSADLAASWPNPHYRLEAKLGAGGMAQVFRALHVPSGRPVAIKVFRRGRIARDVEEQQRRVEAQALRTLRHKNVVGLFDPQAGDGDGYLVMELIEGETATQVVREQGPMPAEIACEVIRQAALALAHMHDRGLVHRDIKPSNIMLGEDGAVKVIDLGLALFGRPARRDASPYQAGTLNYMAPEQFRASDQIDARADIFSLGCTLYFLLTGRHYLQCTRSPSGKRQVKRGPPLDQAAPHTPAWLFRLFKRMVAESADDRPASMGDIAALLPALDDDAAFLTGKPHSFEMGPFESGELTRANVSRTTAA
jgi:serine/threonine-protein kinase